MSDDQIKASVEYGPAEYIVPDVIAVGEYRFPCCGSWSKFPTATFPIPSMRMTCPCGNAAELLPPVVSGE